MSKTTRPTAAAAELRPEVGNDNMLVTMTAGQLRRLVEDAVLSALEEFKQGEQPEQATLSGAELARRLGLSRTRVHHLRHAGMPSIKVGDTFRFELSACLRWLRERSSAAS